MGIFGIDEVGRGSWAGPLVFAGVSLGKDFRYKKDLKDSKLLTQFKRRDLSTEIIATSEYYISEISSTEIDEVGLTAASELACAVIINNLNNINVDTEIILDGNVNYLKDYVNILNIKTVIKADTSYPDVMAASIVAKYYRDKLMEDLDKTYPGYGWDNNVGYGTKQHLEAILKLGLTPIHRLTFRPMKGMI